MASWLVHISLDKINRLTKDAPLRELRVSILPVYESCLESKMNKRPFTSKGEKAKEPLELEHNLWMFKLEKVMSTSLVLMTISQDMDIST